MGKQTGAYQYKGRVGDSVGYRVRYAKNNLLRRADDGLSERVKTDGRYVNLRLYQQEFSAIGKLTSMLISKFPNKDIFFQHSPTVGEFNKNLLPCLNASDQPYGQRSINMGDYIDRIKVFFLNKCKSVNESEYCLYHNEQNIHDSQQGLFVSDIDIFFGGGFLGKLKRHNISFIVRNIYAVNIEPSYYEPSVQNFIPPIVDFTYVGGDTFQVDNVESLVSHVEFQDNQPMTLCFEEILFYTGNWHQMSMQGVSRKYCVFNILDFTEQ